MLRPVLAALVISIGISALVWRAWPSSDGSSETDEGHGPGEIAVRDVGEDKNSGVEWREFVVQGVSPTDLDGLYRHLMTPRDVSGRREGRRPRELSSTTVLQVHRVVRRALDKAVRKGLVARNVATFVDAPRRKRYEIQALTPEQTTALLAAAAGDKLEALYVLAVTTGMRQGELLGLRWQDVDLDAGTVQVRQSLHRVKSGEEKGKLVPLPPKNGRSRAIELTSTAVDALRRRHETQTSQGIVRRGEGKRWSDSGYVFTTRYGEPIEATNLVRRSFKRLLVKAGLPHVRFHDLRHTAATLMLGHGVHPKVVSEILGHGSIVITLDLYSHVTPTMQQQAATAMEAFLNPQH